MAGLFDESLTAEPEVPRRTRSHRKSRVVFDDPSTPSNDQGSSGSRNPSLTPSTKPSRKQSLFADTTGLTLDLASPQDSSPPPPREADCKHCGWSRTAPPATTVRSVPATGTSERYPVAHGITDEALLDQRLWQVLGSMSFPPSVAALPRDHLATLLALHFQRRIGPPPWAERFFRHERESRAAASGLQRQQQQHGDELAALQSATAAVMMEIKGLEAALGVRDPVEHTQQMMQALSSAEVQLAEVNATLEQQRAEREALERTEQRLLQRLAEGTNDIRRTLVLYSDLVHAADTAAPGVISRRGAAKVLHGVLAGSPSISLSDDTRMREAETGAQERWEAVDAHDPLGYQCHDCLFLRSASPFCVVTGEPHTASPVEPQSPQSIPISPKDGKPIKPKTATQVAFGDASDGAASLCSDSDNDAPGAVFDTHRTPSIAFTRTSDHSGSLSDHGMGRPAERRTDRVYGRNTVRNSLFPQHQQRGSLSTRKHSTASSASTGSTPKQRSSVGATTDGSGTDESAADSAASDGDPADPSDPSAASTKKKTKPRRRRKLRGAQSRGALRAGAAEGGKSPGPSVTPQSDHTANDTISVGDEWLAQHCREFLRAVSDRDVTLLRNATADVDPEAGHVPAAAATALVEHEAVFTEWYDLILRRVRRREEQIAARLRSEARRQTAGDATADAGMYVPTVGHGTGAELTAEEAQEIAGQGKSRELRQVLRQVKELRFSLAKRPKTRVGGTQLDDVDFVSLIDRLSQLQRRNDTLRMKMRHLTSRRLMAENARSAAMEQQRKSHKDSEKKRALEEYHRHLQSRPAAVPGTVSPGVLSQLHSVSSPLRSGSPLFKALGSTNTSFPSRR